MPTDKRYTLKDLPKNSNWRLWFLFVVLLSFLFVMSCSYTLHKRSMDESVKIANTYKLANKELEKSIKSHNPDTLKVPYVINEQVLQQMKHNEEMVRELLQVEFDRIQTERNVLEIWAAVITIVFLVFSFYSTFKTDDMVQDAKSVLASLNEIHTEAGKEKAAVEGELKGLLTPYINKANELAVNVSKMESELGKISDLPERLKKIDGMDRYIEISEAKIVDLEESIKEHEMRINTLQEDVDELSSAEPDVEDE